MSRASMTTDFAPTSKCYQFHNAVSREKVFNVVKVGFVTKQKKNLPIYGIKSKDLREVTTTEKDLEKGISRIPL
jgi:hypothetical protein